MPHELDWLAYRFEYESRAMDLEAIFTVERSKPHEPARFVTRNVLQREFLVLPRLYLYLPPEWETVFHRPRYTLLLGRTQDVAGVESVQRVLLEPVSEGEVSGVLLPLELITQNNVTAWLHNLPVAFTDEPQRQPLRKHIFGVVDCHQPSRLQRADGWLIQDTEKGTIVPIYRKEWVLHGEEPVSQIR